MIKNIVFDMGSVLVGYDSERVCRHFISDERIREKVKTVIFLSPEWLMMDMGVITEEEALERMLSRLSGEEEKEGARQCFDHWHEYCMWPISEMGDVIRDLKGRGYGIYLCSNATVRLLKCYKNLIPAIELFDGVLFSAEVKCIKPQKEIYEHLFRQFHLKPEECFFIDDVPLNIKGAEACGMRGWCHKDGDVEKLKKVLKEVTR